MSELPADLRDWLRLHLVPGLGPRLTTALLTRFSTPAAIWAASVGALAQVPRIGGRLAQQLASALQNVEVEAEWRAAQQQGLTLWPRGLPGYPANLRPLPDAPVILYARGQLLPADERAVAIVGTRRCTPYGKRMTERIAAGLARAGVTVVSGLALGIDGVAHRAALTAGGRTIAVLAGGLARLYPREHTDLAADIVQAGAVVSEMPVQTEPVANLFPVRNRIISGLARGVIVVEADDKSGALYTAKHALEQGREVFAVPGPADQSSSAGTNRLLREGARLVRSAEDVLEDLATLPPLAAPAEVPDLATYTAPPELTPPRARAPVTDLFTAAPPAPPAPPIVVPPPAPVAPGPPTGLTEPQLALWHALSEPRQSDELVRLLNIEVPKLMSLVMMLEMKKLIRRLPGNMFARVERS